MALNLFRNSLIPYSYISRLPYFCIGYCAVGVPLHPIITAQVFRELLHNFSESYCTEFLQFTAQGFRDSLHRC